MSWICIAYGDHFISNQCSNEYWVVYNVLYCNIELMRNLQYDNCPVNSKLPKWHLGYLVSMTAAWRLSVCLCVSARRSFFSFNSHDVNEIPLNLWYFQENQNQFNHIKSWNKMIPENNEKSFCNSINLCVGKYMINSFPHML